MVTFLYQVKTYLSNLRTLLIHIQDPPIFLNVEFNFLVIYLKDRKQPLIPWNQPLVGNFIITVKNYTVLEASLRSILTDKR